MTDVVILINLFEVPTADAKKFVAAWEKTRDYLQAQPGFIDTALHQALASDADFQFVNVARWRSAEEFSAAIQSPGMREAATDLAGYGTHPALYHVVRT
jgi:heme oxygenase (mycobilin-producing)